MVLPVSVTPNPSSAIRLPLIVQSALPRFVRPGDSFVAGGIGRVVEGEGGPGLVETSGGRVGGGRMRCVASVRLGERSARTALLPDEGSDVRHPLLMPKLLKSRCALLSSEKLMVRWTPLR